MATTPTPSTSDDLTTRITDLRQRMTAADHQRVQAETFHSMAQKRLAEVDAQIRAQGVEPEKAEEVLAKMEADLAKQLDAVEQALVAETAAYAQILKAGQ